MKKILATALVTGLFAFSAQAALDSGVAAPDFSAQASLAGTEFTYSLKDNLAKGPVVVYFYPSAYTQGCNVQAHTFAINMEKFKTAGATVVGVSLDSIDRLNKFSADPDYCAGKLPVVSDADGSIAESYDLQIRDVREGALDTRGESINHGFAERTTFVVGTDGKVIGTVGGVSPEENVMKSLEIIQKI